MDGTGASELEKLYFQMNVQQEFKYDCVWDFLMKKTVFEVR